MQEIVSCTSSQGQPGESQCIYRATRLHVVECRAVLHSIGSRGSHGESQGVSKRLPAPMNVERGFPRGTRHLPKRRSLQLSSATNSSMTHPRPRNNNKQADLSASRNKAPHALDPNKSPKSPSTSHSAHVPGPGRMTRSGAGNVTMIPRRGRAYQTASHSTFSTLHRSELRASCLGLIAWRREDKDLPSAVVDVTCLLLCPTISLPGRKTSIVVAILLSTQTSTRPTAPHIIATILACDSAAVILLSHHPAATCPPYTHTSGPAGAVVTILALDSGLGGHSFLLRNTRHAASSRCVILCSLSAEQAINKRVHLSELLETKKHNLRPFRDRRVPLRRTGKGEREVNRREGHCEYFPHIHHEHHRPCPLGRPSPLTISAPRLKTPSARPTASTNGPWAPLSASAGVWATRVLAARRRRMSLHLPCSLLTHRTVADSCFCTANTT